MPTAAWRTLRLRCSIAPEEHAQNCRLIDEKADTTTIPGYRIYPNEQYSFDIPLPFSVTLPGSSVPVEITEQSIKKQRCRHRAAVGSDGKRKRPTGWKENGFKWIKTVLQCLASFPQHCKRSLFLTSAA
jgi:hypothetical protein